MSLCNRIQINAYRTSLRSDCFFPPALLSDFGSTQVQRDTERPGGREGREGRACPCTPCCFTEVQRQALDDKRPVGRSVGRLGPYRPIARRGHYSLRSGGICVKLWRLKSCCRSWRSFDSRHCCPGDGPSVPRSTKEPALTREGGRMKALASLFSCRYRHAAGLPSCRSPTGTAKHAVR